MRLIWSISASSITLTLLALSAAAQTTYNSTRLNPLQPFTFTLIHESDGSCTVTSHSDTQIHRLLSNWRDVVIETIPSRPGAPEKVHIIGYSARHVWYKARDICPDLATQEAEGGFSHIIHHNQHAFKATQPAKQPQLEVHPLVVSGRSRNRVDLTFFSDGYTIDEKDKFLADAKRLALDMSQNQTFSTVQPLMNFWAAFAPSQESGIGMAGTPKDTTFGLYRDGTELRAVYCSKKEVARDACLSLHSQCDYPILLGNDPLYGGLGGEFTISTASEINGALVLRHELGHSIIGVGEEYDGGFAYFGVNAAQNLSEGSPFKWSHWLSSLAPGASPRAERAVMSFQSYPWTLLNKTSPWSTTFSSSGLYSRYLVRFSLSGLPLAKDLKVKLNNKDLEWKPRPDVKLDRWHYDIYQTEALASGLHELSFTLGDSAKEGTAQLCSAEIIEYGDEAEFNSTAGHYSAFPTFSNQNSTTFRPTNEDCLMRVVTSPDFCSVCQEGLWLSLLRRVSLIDEFSVTVPQKPETGPIIMDLTLVPLGHLREHTLPGESFAITWQKDGVSLPDFANLTRVTVGGDNMHGMWRAHVQLHTPEVRVDVYHLLEQTAEVHLAPSTTPNPAVRVLFADSQKNIGALSDQF